MSSVPLRECRRVFKDTVTVKSKALSSGRAMVRKDRIVLGAGFLCLLLGFFLNLTWESIVDSNVSKEFVLSESSKTFEPWVKNRVPIYIRFYFWNWTNPETMKGPNYKPSFDECGPYTFREETEKVDIVWNQNGTVTYKRQRYWFFEPDLSSGSIDDSIRTINVVAKSAAFITRYSGVVTKIGLNLAMASTQSLDVTKPVREILFEGYSNTLINTAKTLPSLAGVTIPFDRFGWFYKRNGSIEFDGVFNIETGLNGMDSFGKIRQWNYGEHTSFFEGECGAVRGSGGEFFPPKRTKSDTIEMFSPDLCRVVSFNFKREEVLHGVKGYKYEMDTSMFDNGEGNEDNSCFCGGECAPPGALNVSSCRMGAPAFVSMPHFYAADPSYREAVVGMKPDPERHESHLTMEPTYAIPLDVAVRLQINILVQPYDGMSLFKGVSKVYFPIMWFEQTAHIPEDTVEIVEMLLLLPLVGVVASFILLGIGAVLVLSVVVFKYYSKRLNLSLTDDTLVAVEPMLESNGTSVVIKKKLEADGAYQKQRNTKI